MLSDQVLPSSTTSFKYYFHQVVTQDFLKFAKVAKFRQIWSLLIKASPCFAKYTVIGKNLSHILNCPLTMLYLSLEYLFNS